jgi:hypothetical protein
MKRQKVITALGLALFIIVSGCKGKDRIEAPAKDSAQTATNIGEKKSHDTQKLEKTEEARESSAVDVWRDGATDVSIIQLISNPEKFDGKYVRLIGFVRVAFEGDAIYLHEDDYKYGLTKNGLWLNLTKDIYEKEGQKFDRKYVLVEGTFSAKNRGHMGLFSGGIDNIKRFEVWVVKRDQERTRTKN